MRSSMKCVVMLALMAIGAVSAAEGTVETNNDLICNNDLRIAKLSLGDSDTTGSVVTEEFRTGTLQADNIQATTVIISSLDISSINPGTSDGSLQLIGLLNAEGLELLQTKSTVKAKANAKAGKANHKSFLKEESAAVEQWKLLVEENLEQFGEQYPNSKDHINGWTLGNSFRKQVLDYELKRPSTGSETTKKNQETVVLSKLYRGLSAHKQLLLDGVFHFDTAMLAGKAVFVKVDGRIAWLQHNKPHNSTNCDEELKYCDAGWATPVNVIIPHQSENLRVEIGVIHKTSDNNECLIRRFSDYFTHCSNHFSLSTR